MADNDSPQALTDEEIYGEAKPRTYREAVTAEHLKVLQSAGQEPHDDEGADAAAADVDVPVTAPVPDPAPETPETPSDTPAAA